MSIESSTYINTLDIARLRTQAVALLALHLWLGGQQSNVCYFYEPGAESAEQFEIVDQVTRTQMHQYSRQNSHSIALGCDQSAETLAKIAPRLKSRANVLKLKKYRRFIPDWTGILF